MAKKKVNEESQYISEIIIHGIQEKKGNDIVRLDLRNINSSLSDYFIICHAESTTQVRAIADNVEEEVFKTLRESPWKKEGMENAEWVLLDYVDVVVHIFKKEKREFYGVEQLWGDADIQMFRSA